jgi:hypothetical protein
MEDLFDIEDHAAMRDKLLVHYADTLEAIKGPNHTFDHHRALFNGIQRFIFEDSLYSRLIRAESNTQRV